MRLLAPALFLALLPGLAEAQGRRAAPHDPVAACRADCLAAARPGAAAVDPARACAIRCDAAAAFQARQSRPGTAEATGRGGAPAPLPPAVRPALPAPAPAPAQGVSGVIYGARMPAAFGMAVGTGDRLAAHREAERRCSAAGPGCRVLAEFTDACGAAAQGRRRSQGALFITSDPGTHVVTSLSPGSGATRAVAEAEALAACRSRDPGASCRVVASSCARRG
jgi:hypothetical protein